MPGEEIQPTTSHLPENHPPINAQKTGVLLLNLGTPEATDYWTIRRYLSEFLSDKRVIDYPSWFWQPILQGIILSRRPYKTAEAYEKVWNNELDESPLRTYTRSQCEKIQAQFINHPHVVFEWGMRYGFPTTEESIQKLVKQGCTRILFFALYPQYSATTTATAYDTAFDTLKKLPWQPAIRTAGGWHDDPNYIEILANSIQQKINELEREPEVILTSFHGLPKRYLMQGDPYHCFCCKTSRLAREKLGWAEDRWINTFQSRFGPEKWLEPYTDKTIEKLAKDGVKRIAIVSPAFVSECIETLEEMNIAGRELFMEHGGEEFTYIPCLNDSGAHIDFLSNRIRHELQGWL